MISFQRNKVSDAAFIFIIIVIGLAFRRYDMFINPQLYAEDGVIFLQQFYEKGLATFITPYAGYLHTIQRLIVIFWGWLHVNLIYIPTLYAATTILVMFFIAYRIWQTTFYLGLVNRIAYAVFFVFVPTNSDIFLNITNLNGMLSLYLINFLFVRNAISDSIKSHSIIELIILFIVSLSGPTSIFLCPVIALILFVERKTLAYKKVLPLAVIFICGVLQLITVKFIDTDIYRGVNEGATEHYHTLKFFIKNVADLMYIHYGIWPDMSHRTTMIVFLIAFMIILALVIKSYRSIKNTDKYVIASVIGLYFASVIVAYWPDESYIYALRNASRYFIVPYTCIGWVFILAVDKKLKKEHIALYLLFFTLHTKYIKFELPDKRWKEQIMEYRKGNRDIIEINPEGWHFRLPERKK